MNKIAYDNILNRRSVKKYKQTPVSEEIIERIIKAGMFAPTGRNSQSPIIIAITDKKTRDRLSALNAKIWGRELDPFYGAPVVLVVLANKKIPTYIYDGSLVMGNLMLAANAEGLGSCWIHRAKEEFETDEGRALLRSLGIEGDFEGIGHCIIGYPDGEIPCAKERKENYIYYVKES